MGDVSAVRALVIAAIDAVSGWKESRFAPELFGRDTSSYADHAFTVAAPSTVPNSREGRQPATADGAYVATRLEVRWMVRLRGDAQSDDYGAALDAEQEVVKAARGVAALRPMVVDLSRESRAEGWVFGRTVIVVHHRYALA